MPAPAGRDNARRYNARMPRPDGQAQLLLPGGEGSPSCCTSPGGASPAPVGVGAPGSRHRAGRIPLGSNPARGPQHRANVAAWRDEPAGSPAAPVRAKAKSGWQDPKRAPDEPKVKPAAVQRESEGLLAPLMPAQHDAGVGKSPRGDRVGTKARREGMAGQQDRSHRWSNSLEQPLPHRERRREVRSGGFLRVAPPAQLPDAGQAAAPACRRSPAMAPRFLLKPRALPTARHRWLPGACVMPLPERSPVSRVLGNCRHGSKGGPAVTPRQEVK